MDFYTLDYIFAETQFTAALSANLREGFVFTRLSDRMEGPSVIKTHLNRIEVPASMMEHLAAQSVVDEGVAYFTRLLTESPIDDIRFTRIDVLKALNPSADGSTRTFALLVEYAVPAAKTIKTF
jgi:hypothetical protein